MLASMHHHIRPAPRLLIPVVAALVAALTAVGPASPASAHAVLVSTSPPPGALLDAAPAEVTVTLNETVSAESDSIVVIDAEGRVVSGPAEARGATIVAPIEAGTTGWHAVSWWAVSADGHPVSGAWTFRIGAGDDTAPEGLEERAAASVRPDETTRWAYFVAQWASTLATVVAAGTAFVALVLGTRRELSLLWLGSAVTGALLSLLAAGLNGPYSAVSAGWFDGPASDHLLARALLLGVVVVLVGTPTRPRGGRPPEVAVAPRIAVLVLSAAALAAPVLVGHTSSKGPGATLAVVAHLAVAGSWLGGTPALLLATSRSTTRSRDLAAFSRAATWLLAATLVAGAAGVQLLTDGLPNASKNWAWALFAKIALVGVAVTAGTWTRVNVVPRADELPRSEATLALKVEALALVGVVVASMALTHHGPPSTDGVATAGPAVVDVTDAGVRVQLIVDPARVGDNDVHLFLLDEVGMPLDVTEVTVAIRSDELGVGRIELELAQLGAGHHSATIGDFGRAGDWEVQVVVRPDPFSQVELTGTIRIRP
jgi:copper transport protein